MTTPEHTTDGNLDLTKSCLCTIFLLNSNNKATHPSVCCCKGEEKIFRKTMKHEQSKKFSCIFVAWFPNSFSRIGRSHCTCANEKLLASGLGSHRVPSTICNFDERLIIKVETMFFPPRAAVNTEWFVLRNKVQIPFRNGLR